MIECIISIFIALFLWAVYIGSLPLLPHERFAEWWDKRELERDLEQARRNGEWLMRKIEADKKNKETPNGS